MIDHLFPGSSEIALNDLLSGEDSPTPNDESLGWCWSESFHHGQSFKTTPRFIIFYTGSVTIAISSLLRRMVFCDILAQPQEFMCWVTITRSMSNLLHTIGLYVFMSHIFTSVASYFVSMLHNMLIITETNAFRHAIHTIAADILPIKSHEPFDILLGPNRPTSCIANEANHLPPVIMDVNYMWIAQLYI